MSISVHCATFFNNICKPARDSVNTATKNREGQSLWRLTKTRTQMDVSSQKSGITGKLPFSQRNMKCNRYNKCMLDVPSFQIRPTYSCNVSTQTTYEVVQDGTECGYIKHRQNTSACFLEVEFKQENKHLYFVCA